MVVPVLLASLIGLRAPAPAPDLGMAIDSLIQAEVENGTLVGIYICQPDGKVLYSRMADTRFIPASNEKILSSVLAFDRLGSDFQFRTRFWRDGDDVWVDAPGDQTITSSQLFDVKRRLGVSGRGVVHVRQAYRFDFGPSWEDDDKPFRYAPACTAFSVDRAQFEVSISGGIPTVPDWCGVTVRHIDGILPATVEYDRTHAEVTIRGHIDEKPGVLATFALRDPDLAAARILGMQFVPTQKVPNRAPDAEILSVPLRDYARLCLEPSDNLLAESLLLSGSGKGNWPDAAKFMAEYHTKLLQLRPGAIRPEDGSGMSRHNLATPFALAQLLRHAYAQPYRDDFIRAMAHSGEGTMRVRLTGLDVTAKTGTLDSVSCLSGFLGLPGGRTVVFSIMMNHYTTTAAEARKLQDALIQAIYDSLSMRENEHAIRDANWCDRVEQGVPLPGPDPVDGHWLY